ncbi:exopolysaccharide biosynthesis polyprenyl glycosylphosphotransferase [Tenacibaculum maritimum]
MELFKNKKELGYQFIGFFDDETSKKNDYLGALIDSKKNILKKEVDEIYCSIQSLTKNQIKDFTKFANKYSKTIKLIPSATELYSKNYNATYYEDTITVLDVQKLPFDLIENRIIKRVFDIIFSTFVCIFVLSWVVPILWIIVKLDSKGPLFFKQEREGIEGNHFTCYKFRSMKSNSSAEKKHTSKNDTRVTKVGAFLRKTSIDELPQFFNALKGNMSVVGPRPHIKEESLQFEKDVANYMERKSVKPGITGLAQVSGYRGEIQKKSDIKNRVRLDVFYIENWSFFLDIKIIIQTVLNVFKGDEKAY